MPELLLTCEHGGNHIPPRYRPAFADAQTALASHRGYDPGALPLATHLATTWDLPLISLKTSRLLIEINRSEHHPNLFSTWSRTLSKTDRGHLLNHIYRPYRQQVVAAIASRQPPVIHLAIHSFTPVLDGRRRQADIGLLYDPARQPEVSLCQAWQHNLRQQADLRIRRNYPYRGSADGLTTWLRGQFSAETYLGIEVEVNQAMLTGPTEIQAVATLLAEAFAPACAATTGSCRGGPGVHRGPSS